MFNPQNVITSSTRNLNQRTPGNDPGAFCDCSACRSARSAPDPCGFRSKASRQPWLDRCRHPSTRRFHCLLGAPTDDGRTDQGKSKPYIRVATRSHSSTDTQRFFGVVAPAATNKRGFSPSTRSGVGGHRQTGRAPAMACHVRDLDWQTTPRGAIEPQRLFRALANLGGHTKTYGRRRSNTLVSEPRWLADAERGFLWPQRNR
jgi:hypothetical protein